MHWALGDSADKSKAVDGVSNKARKRPVKPHAKNPWGKLISQCSLVGFQSLSFVIVSFHVTLYLVSTNRRTKKLKSDISSFKSEQTLVLLACVLSEVII